VSKNPSGKPRKEAYFVQIENADKTPMFVNVSAQLGKPLGFKKPLATTMMRVRDDAVLFSTLKVHKRVLPQLVSGPLAMQPGPLRRLERRMDTIEGELDETRLIVELDDKKHELSISRDENGVATVEMAGADAEEVVFELPKPALQLTLYLRSPRTKRLMIVGWQGYQNKPGSPETVSRAAALALNHLSGLTEFQVLSGIATVRVPPSPSRYQIVAPTRSASDKVEFVVPTRLWTVDAAPLLAGTVKVNVDLDNANPATSQLLFHTKPSKELEGAEFDATYRPVLERALSAAFVSYLGDEELTDLVCDIALGDINEGALGRLRDAAATVTGFDLNPRAFAVYNPNA
jgi:hypothetical protein